MEEENGKLKQENEELRQLTNKLVDRICSLEDKLMNMKEDVMREAMGMIQKEVYEQMKRQKNIIVFGLKEPERQTAKEKKDEDLEHVKAIVQEELGLPEPVIKNAIRIGRKTPG